MRETIVKIIREIGVESGASIVDSFEDNTVLLESGLDSLGFAILVARLEEELGYDPFTMMDEPVYPRTFAEFVSIYEQFAQ